MNIEIHRACQKLPFYNPEFTTYSVDFWLMTPDSPTADVSTHYQRNVQLSEVKAKTDKGYSNYQPRRLKCFSLA